MLERIGIGGMGVVWQAMDERLQRLVAVKQLLLQPQLSPRATDEARARALREARIAARLQHPNAIVIYDVAEHEGEPCLVMEYLPSRSLAVVLGEQGCLPVPEVASIGRQIASALAAAHAAQIVHRDVKPGNILITDGGTAKITDFGVSRAVGDVTVTQTGMVAGTPAYLAPEVARGQVPTSASDVFSLGATLYAAVEGRGPFGTSDNPLALLHAVAGGQVAPPQQAGPLAGVLMRLLAAEPAARPDMRSASRELAVLRTPPPRPASAPDRKPTAALPPTRVARSPELGSAAPGSRTVAGEPHTAAGADPLADTAPALPPPVSPLGSTQRRPTRPRLDRLHLNQRRSDQRRPDQRRPDQRRPDRRRRRAAGVVGAVLAMLASAVVGVLLSEHSPGKQSAHAVEPAPTPVPTAAPAPTRAPAVISPPPQVERVDHAQPIGWSDAGQLVIDYYNGLSNPSSAWQLLSPTAQAVFGDESGFRSHWSQYSSVSARNAFGVTDNPDGSVRVPVDVTYQTGGNAQVVKRALRVARLGGRLLIDSDPR